MKQKSKTNDSEKDKVVRASVSFPMKDYSGLEEIAESKRVSVAWVVREAVIEYLQKSKVDILA